MKGARQEPRRIMGEFKNVILQGNTIRFRTGMTTYAETLEDGIYKSLGFNGAGYALGAHPLSPGAFHANYAFMLEIDGQSLISHWEKIDEQVIENEKNVTVKTVLRHQVRPVEVTVCTLLDGSCCFSRWLEVKNLSDKPAAVSRIAPLSGALEQTPRWREHLSEEADSPYQLGYFEYCSHMHEMQFKRHPLPNANYTFGGRYSRMRYRHPFFVLENAATGTTFVGQMAYSGGYSFSFDVNSEYTDCYVTFSADVDALHPLRVMEPGETISTPKMIIGMVNGDMDEAVNGMHEHIRRSIMRPQTRGRGLWIETAGHGRMSADRLGVDRAAAQGAELFYIDAGWYFPMQIPKGTDCLAFTGTWEVDKERYPNGITELADYCHEKGLLFGMWMEPERIGSLAAAAKTHMDYVTKGYNKKNNGGHPYAGEGGCVDLARPEVEEWVYNEIEKMISTCKIDMFRLDFNHVFDAPTSCNEKDEYLENSDFRYHEAFGRIFGKLREKFPNVIFENCASGGGRTDLGAVQYFDHTWVTDNPIAPRCFGITNGATMCLPPEYVDRLVTTMGAPNMGNLNFDLYQLLFVRPTAHYPSIYYGPDTVENPEQKAFFDRFTYLYKNYSQKMIVGSKIYHHTPALNGRDPKGVGMLEMVSEDKSMAMFGVFALSDPKTKEQVVRFKGIDASKKYKVTMDSCGESFEMDGYRLKYDGVTVRLPAALTAELILLEEKK